VIFSPNTDSADTESNRAYLAYGQYTGDPTPKQLEQFFRLEPRDHTLIATRRRNDTRLGLALQLCTLRFLGTFLEDPSAVPEAVLNTLQQQLHLDQVNLERYRDSDDARLDHRQLILEHLEYREFEGAPFIRVTRMLIEKLRLSNEATPVLIDAVTQSLEQHRVVLPGIKRILTLIGRVRRVVSAMLYRDIEARLTSKQRAKLEPLLLVPDESSAIRTRLETLRTPPIVSSTVSLQAALDRIEAIRSLGVGKVNLEDIAENKLAQIVRYGLVVRSADLANASSARRTATLTVVLQHLERSAVDDALTVFDTVMNSTGLRGQRRRQKERLRTLKDLDAAALTLRDVTRIVLDSSVPAGELRQTIFQQFGEAALNTAVSQVTDLASVAEDLEAEVWENAHRSISPFILELLSTIKFEGTPGVKSLLSAMKFVQQTSGTARSTWGEPPRGFIPRSWLNLIFPGGSSQGFKRHHYVVCVAHQLHAALKRGDVFVRGSNRHADPRAQMLTGNAWDVVRHDVIASLGLSDKPEASLKRWAKTLDATYRRVARALPDHPLLRVSTESGAPELIITPFEALPESESYKALVRNIESRLPRIALTELALEINARIGFAGEMIRGSPFAATAPDLELSVIAVLIAEACNIGLTAVADERHPALRLARLDWAKKHFVHADTITRANVLLVEYHSNLPITRRWGGGEVATADGLRFVVPVKTIHAGANPKYFGVGRGITYYTLVSDQFTQLHGRVVPGTLRDSLYILASLLEQQTSLRPAEVIADTGAYSDVVFGLFFLLGYTFSPRLKDAGGSRFWRINREAKYGALDEVARHKINTALIALHWEDVLRLVGSLKLGKLKALDAMRVLSRDGHLGGLGKAVQEIGRIAKTLYLLGYVSDEATQRRVHLELQHGETRHSLARATGHGNQGEIRQHYVRGMEAQLGALGFMVNVIVLWNSLYTGAALSMIEAMGDEVLEMDVERLTPLK
jgi:TnpA family transposase